jgi:HD-GYP domain-containing protein (c-di-GMP phosphodiesterase class II)
MTAINILAFIIIVLGGITTVLAAVKYHKLLNFYRQEAYQSLRISYSINQVILYLLIAISAIGAVDVLLINLDGFFIIMTVIFLLTTIYVYFTVQNQIAAAHMLRDKTLEAIRAFVNTIDLKDYADTGHSKHVYDIVNLFYDQLEDYHLMLNKAKLLDAAILHDIGKINMDAELFNKRQKLEPEEWELIKTHPVRGKEMLDQTFFREISDWVKFHHERVDGNGYYHVESKDIPLEAKIIAIADTYSALTKARAYRPALSYEEAMEIIKKDSGRQFDSQLVERFLRITKEDLQSVSR